MRDKLQNMLDTYTELTAKLGDPAVLADQKEYTRLAKEQRCPGPARREGARVPLGGRAARRGQGDAQARRATRR